MKYTYEELAGMIDHSLLHPTMTDEVMEAELLVAREYRVAAVCVKPYYVARSTEVLKGSEVAVCTVVGFPHGSSTTSSKVYETAEACTNGATEIDMVANIGKVLSGDWEYVAKDIHAVVECADSRGSIVKVILETDYLPDDSIKMQLCRVIEQQGAEFVKTSTGYGFVKQASGQYSYLGATEHDLLLMRSTCSPHVRIKAAGGVRDLDSLMRCRELGCSRVGATATKAMMDEYRRRASGEPLGSSSETASGDY